MHPTYQNKKEPIHFVGIGGIGMSGIAEVLFLLGFPVSGSDVQESLNTERLKKLGIRIAIGHNGKNLEDSKVLVISSAVAKDNPEILEAKKRGLPVVSRAEMLAELMRLKFGVAIAGTHGKTTTTSMLGTVLLGSKLDPTIIVGGKVSTLGGNAKLGQGIHLVAEADESDGSFLKLFPIVSIITNIDNDHMDHYGNMNELTQAFISFANKVPYYGRVILCSDDSGVQKIIPHIEKPYWTYGFQPQPADAKSVTHFQIIDFQPSPKESFFRISKDGENILEIKLPFPGKHNALNATATIAASLELGLKLSTAGDNLNAYKGVGRRFELKGEIPGTNIPIIDDYGHHPREIAVTLEAARQYWPQGRIIVAFQPHRFSRTQLCWDEFASALKNAEFVGLLDIYPAGEAPLPGISSASLCEHLKSQGLPVEHCGDLAEAKRKLKTILQPGDLLITLGAGNITKLGPLMMEIT